MTGHGPADAPSAPAGAEAGQQSAFMSALVTEHFVLQAAASTTVSEAAGRAALYLSVLSSSLVAMGFASQSAHRFALFAVTVIPAVVVLGLFTTARLVDTGVQNVAFLAGIARIRGYYRTLPAGDAQYFAPWGQPSQDEIGQALASLSRTRSALTGLGTTAAMVAAINSIVAGIGVVLAVIQATGPGGTVAGALTGAVIGAVFFGGFLTYQNRRYKTITGNSTPAASAGPGEKGQA